MYARVVHVQMKLDKFQETIDLYRESVLPAAQEQAGFQGAWLLTNKETGKGISITVWDSEASMKAGESSGYFQAQLGKFGAYFAGPPSTETYEVSVQPEMA